MCDVDWKMLLEYLKVLLNWPPLIAILGAWVTYLFRTEIKQKLRTLHQVKLGGQEAVFVEQTQPTMPVTEVKLPGEDEPEALHEAQPDQPVNYNVSNEALYLVGGSQESLNQAMAWARNNPGPTIDEFLRLSEKLQFEKIFSSIYGSQVAALVFASKWITPHPMHSLQAFADLHRERASASGTIELESFLGYLTTQGLLSKVAPEDTSLVFLTERGKRFLDYIQTEHPHVWHLRPW